MWNISLRSMWNEICPCSRSEHFTFAKQIFHREAISLAPMGKFRWRTCFIAGAPRDTYHKAGYTNLKYNKRSTGNFSCTPFHTSCPARYSVLHLFDLLSGGNISEMFCYRKTWNNMLSHIVKYLALLDVKWNLPTFAERTFHICEANISPRSDFTCPNGQISLAHLRYSRCAKRSLISRDRDISNRKRYSWCRTTE